MKSGQKVSQIIVIVMEVSGKLVLANLHQLKTRK